MQMAQVELRATLEGSSLALANLQTPQVATFVLDTVEHTVTFRLADTLTNGYAEIRGFVPRGWASAPLLNIRQGEREGVWTYEEWQEKNILSGLAYLSFKSPGDGATVLRAQIEPTQPPTPKLEDFVTTTGLAGACETFISVMGLDRTPLRLEPAQVILARSAARDAGDGRREQDIGCQIRVGGAQIDGLGKISIEMFGEENPGHIISLQAGSDFPARMTFNVRKRYMTPYGNFYSDREQFTADIPSYPPFGTQFMPINADVPLRDERTDQVVGQVHLGWLTPLCCLDKQNFPPKAFPLPTKEI
jgi:hypothetical protein